MGCAWDLQAQNSNTPANTYKLDSLMFVFNAKTEDSTKIKTCNAICDYYLHLNQSQEAMQYAQRCQEICKRLLPSGDKKFLFGQMALSFSNMGKIYYNSSNYDKGVEFYEKALDCYGNAGDKRGTGNCINNIGLMHYMQGNYSTAFDFFNRALSLRKLIKDKKGLAGSYNNMGLLFDRQGNYPMALEYHFKAIAIREELKDYTALALSLTNIGVIYSNQKNYDKALEYYNNALKISLEREDRRATANNYNNIGVIYEYKNDLPQAIKYNLLAMDVRTKIGDEYGIATSYGNLGSIYWEQKIFSQALLHFQKSLAIREKIKDSLGIALSLNRIGKCYFSLKNTRKAESYCNSGYLISKRIHELTAIQEADMNLSEIYQSEGNFQQAFFYYKDYVKSRDSLINEDNTKKTVRAEMNYEFEKKQAIERLEQEKKNALAEAANHRQNLIIQGGSAILLLVLIFAILIYRGFLQKQKANIEISKQKQIIEGKQKEIVDSIHYAKRIQSTMLTSEQYFSTSLSEFFILYQPKDIVSGDFYWGLDHDDKFYLLIADCTGHGVPGAFMSLINIAFMNETIIERKILRPDLILNEVRNKLVRSMRSEKGEEGMDGMDCVLCTIDFQNASIQYAAANNSLYRVRDGKLNILPADKMPVGKGVRNDPFTLQELDIKKGDLIYLLTDGYADQFGGSKGKKFKYKNVEAALLKYSTLTLQQQKSELQNVFVKWKGNLDQVDDVLIFGFRV